MAEKPIGPGTVLAGRFRLEDLLQESSGAKFWRACDLTLARNVAVHVIPADDKRADALLGAARASATVTDGHILRVLDAATEQGITYVVNEWGSGVSLDRMLAEGPLSPRRAAWVAKEVADALDVAHRNGVAHGRLIPENVMVSEAGAVKLIGFVVDGVLNGTRTRGDAPRFGDQASDVANLAALLYAALVGKWPGRDGTSLPRAPMEHGHPLRPRQVRAGIPRPLDAICDRVLNADHPHRHAAPIETAAQVAAELSDFIGDPTGTGQVDYEHTVTLPRAVPPRQPNRVDPTPAAGPTPPVPTPPADPAAADPTPADPAAADPAAADPTDPEPTQAGAPVFFDEGSAVGWISSAESALGERRHTPPPPPPPLPEPEPKPLFAPDPPGGRPRRGWDTASARDSAEPTPGHDGAEWSLAAPQGTGSLPPVWGPDADQVQLEGSDDWEAERAGRGWLRLAGIVAGCLLLVFAVVAAYNFGRGPGAPASQANATSPSSTPHATTGRPIPIKNVRDFDPQGDPPRENPAMAPLATDGDPSTAWQTMTYYGNPRLGGLKTGVGLRLDLGGQHTVSSVSLTLQGQPTSLEILSSGPGDTAPTSLDGLHKVAAAENAGTHVDLRLQHPVTTRYLVVWLTSLPPYNGGYRGRVAEIQVRS